MKQYLITGIDYKDALAAERRMNARPDHLAGMSALKKMGNFVTGGATLNPSGNMTGSVIILQFESEADLEHWKATEPYLIQNVWETIDIKAFKVADIL
jgi:uncharacterized protein YciI